MDRNETNTLVKGALLLTIAGLISKILSAGYRIPLQNMTGDIGFYIYQQVYPILGIALVLALYGFPSAISKMTVDLKAEGRIPSFTRFYIPIFIILCGINGVVFLSLFVYAPLLAKWVGDVNLADTYRFAAFVFLFIPFAALLRGVFQGNYQMKPTAYSQIGEQFIRVIMIITAAVVVAIQGRNFYEIGHAAVLASILGFATATLILVWFFIKEEHAVRDTYQVPWSYYIRMILTLGMVAALNHMVLLVIQFADTFTLIPSLMDYGLSQVEAMEAKGVFDRGQPLIQLGTVLGSSFALALVPTISRQKLEKDPDTFHHYIRGAMLFSFYLAIGATVGLMVIFPEANVLLFQNDQGTADLQILVSSILLCSLAITAAAILQGLGFMKRTAGFIAIAFFIKWISNQLLVPWLGITGSAVATVFSLLILCGLVLVALKRKLPHLHFFEHINRGALVKAVLAMVVYIIVVEFIFSYIGTSTRIGLLVYIVFVSVTGGIIFIYSLLKGRAFTARELAMLPFAQTFIRIHKGRKINE
ncbi:polysaccharide biosynthesis protein [Virgibacillus sp. NKC19-3]|uniref:putative polysaccharide biosynthesis protein n=1 Tax=Virgibacillus saliphilus TaxID=2831674 RepID=UPI001C9A8A0E|nr:polysaccharide biosynthesis protein [Virgibacillus sp. NKC19-3]MBY7141632.1 polysaccharide biosynthesis protein [Virgibacillus sp. NKC19-3]